MNFSLKPHQLVAHWVPGVVLLMLIPVIHPSLYGRLEPLLPHGEALRVTVYAILAFVVGEFLDCVRDISECLWDRWSRVNWDFFFEADAPQLERLRDSYFTYYVFNYNLALSLLYFSFAQLAKWHLGWFAGGLVVACIFIYDARSLRKEIARHTAV